MKFSIEKVQSILSNVGFESSPEKAAKWRTKWNNLRGSSKARGIQCTLTLDQYVKLAKKANIKSPAQVGKKKGCYQLGRIGDKGGYTLGNCRFITVEQNQKEKVLNGGSARAGKKSSVILSGRTKNTHPYLMRMAEKISVISAARTKENDEGRIRQAEKISKSFRIVSPSGRIYDGKNLKLFCREHGLRSVIMSRVCNGYRFHHKGWVGEYR